MTSRRVVHVLPRFSPGNWGGAETAVVNLGPRLEERGYRCEVWTNRLPGEAVNENIGGTPVTRFTSHFLGGGERDLSARGKSALSPAPLKNVIAGARPDVFHVHTHNRVTSTIVLAARARRVPTVVTLHSRFELLTPRWRYWFPNEAAIRHADGVIGVSDAVLEMVAQAGIRPRRRWCIPNGVDASRGAAADGDSFRDGHGIGASPLIVCVGRVYGLKNQAFLIEAFRHVLHRLPDARLVMIGFPADPEYFEKVSQAVATPELASKVLLLTDVTPDDEILYEAYAAADVVAIPSTFEASPLVALEAWAAGAPVVAHAVGGLRKMVVDGDNGLLVDLSDDPRAFAAALVRALTDEALAAVLREGAFATAPRYSWDAAAEATAEAYRAVIR